MSSKFNLGCSQGYNIIKNYRPIKFRPNFHKVKNVLFNSQKTNCGVFMHTFTPGASNARKKHYTAHLKIPTTMT